MFCVNRNGWLNLGHRFPHDVVEVIGSTCIRCLFKTKKEISL